MSTLKTINVQHPSSASANLVLDSSGNASVANDLKFNSGYGSVATAYGCRAWVNFNGTGTVAIRASGNVTSITDNNTGDYTVNFTTAMPDTNYSPSAVVSLNTAGSDTFGYGIKSTGTTSITNMTTSSWRFKTGYLGGAQLDDPALVAVQIFR